MPCLPTHTRGPGADDFQADQGDPARTPRKQLEDALEGYIKGVGIAEHLAGPANTYNWRAFACDYRDLLQGILDRARAEPETHRREDLLVALDELFAGEYAHHHASDQAYDLWANAHKAFKTAQSELSCPDICDTSCRCYQEGLEAQRERVGGGAA